MTLRDKAFLVSAIAAMCCGRAAASPEKFDSNSEDPAKWAPNTTINVYIPRDPDPTRSRQDQVKAGIDSWVSSLPAGMTINSVILDAGGNIPGTGKPPDSKTSIVVEWTDDVSAGDFTPSLAGEATGKKAADGTTDILKNQQITGGVIRLVASTTAFPDDDNLKARKMAMHEMGHGLGLAHSTNTQSVMQATFEQYMGLSSPNEKDGKEVNSIYTTGQASIDSSVLNLGDGLYRYSYTATWTSGGDLSLVTILTCGASITNVQMPGDWELVDYPLDDKQDVLWFRIGPEENGYLSSDNPTVVFAFDADRPPQISDGWAGTIQDVWAPIPEPGVACILAVGLTVMYCRRFTLARMGACRRRLRLF